MQHHSATVTNWPLGLRVMDTREATRDRAGMWNAQNRGSPWSTLGSLIGTGVGSFFGPLGAAAGGLAKLFGG